MAKFESLSVARWIDRGFYRLTAAFAVGIAGILVWILVTLFQTAYPAIAKFGLGFLFSSRWSVQEEIFGALPLIYGTVVSALVALAIAVPIGVGIAVFLTEDFLPAQIRTPIAFVIELLAAVPSVVYGLWAIVVFIPFVKPVLELVHQVLGWIPLFGSAPTNVGLMYTSLILAIMISPTIIAISRDSLVSLPPQLRQGALALGATRWETILKVLLPASLSGIVGAVMLALGRALGETMVAAMLIGSKNAISASLFAPGQTIASMIANQFGEATGLQRASLLYAGLILMLITLAVNVLAELIISRFQQVEH
ncbi:MAG: phosphate ABC transporter permease subunit PstC [Synechococcales cyanobacterium RU_4_20]|nr:phosphate ABC transporter permease subunit PstC [Synechococcales cyanobacterium RU_4_20]NJR67403.1 phosphate ABC transporter permease subunit PstC [Synechococcales cyanobacterium CRU_2_2]